MRNAERATAQTLQAHSAYAECWSGFLGLYYLSLKGEHESPYEEGTVEHVAWHLRQALLVAALDTSKIALDATLAGHYAQALMLTRHLFETWLQVRYARLRPDQAVRWFNTLEHGPPREPNYNSIIKEVLKNPENKEATIWVNEAVTELNKAAHPSWWIVEQVRGGGDELTTLGGRYDRTWCRQAFDRGTLATIALMLELRRHLPQPEEWQMAFERLLQLRNTEYPERPPP